MFGRAHFFVRCFGDFFRMKIRSFFSRIQQLLLLIGCLAMPLSVLADGSVWVLVDTEAAELRIMQGKRVIQSFPDIALGRYGVTANKRRMDNMTPLGEFRITRITRNTRFQLFLGLSYPNTEHARLALEQGWLSESDWRSIERAERRGVEPPQDTPLGGYIGIHGVGEGDPELHELFNWTNGCIALGNDQIEELVTRVGVGTRVIIR